MAPSGSASSEVSTSKSWRKFFEVTRPYFSKLNPNRQKACWLSALTIMFMFAETWVLVQISYNQRAFSTAMSDKDIEGFYQGVLNYVVILAIAAPLYALSEYTRGRLALDWRQWLTKYFSCQYFLDRAYFHLKNGARQKSSKEDNKSSRIDNPDQRIANDIESFTAACVTVIVLFGGKIFRVCTFLGVLYSISPELVGFCLLYSAVGTGITTVFFGGKLRDLHYTGIKSEADFRFSLVRTREYAEEIAFYHGGQKEMDNTISFFEKLIAICKLQLKWNSWLKGFQNGFSWVTYVLPYLIVAQKYFNGEMEFGVISQSSFAFQVVQGGLSFIVQNIRTLSSLAAETDRLHELMYVLEGFHSSKKLFHNSGRNQVVDKQTSNDDDELTESLLSTQLPLDKERNSTEHQNLIKVNAFSCNPTCDKSVVMVQNLTLLTPDEGKVICKNLSFSLARGESLLLFARSGAGKSSLLRAICGLWNVGNGEIERPQDDQALFLPQKPYMPVGNLEEQMLYPNARRLSEDKMVNILTKVNLSHILDRVGSMRAERDWSDELSLGEQQRLAFSRLLCSKPVIAFLDESTSGLDKENEKSLYSFLKDGEASCYVSIGHKPTLFSFHTHILYLEDEDSSQWSFQPMKFFLNQHQEYLKDYAPFK